MNRSTPQSALLTLLLALSATQPAIADPPTAEPPPASQALQSARADYAGYALAAYGAAERDAEALLQQVEAFASNPSDANFRSAKDSWLAARDSYGRTEAFRFYGGPIDDADGPELRINSWPVDERLIEDGLIGDPSVRLDARTLSTRNGAESETDVTLGFHAIEYLLWGEDTFADGPGRRAASEFAGDESRNARRRQYLTLVTRMLVADLEEVRSAWEPDPSSYATEFLSAPAHESVARALKGLAELIGFEMALERLAVPLDSREQEDEHSCFSDNTHNDFRANLEGVRRIYLGGAAYGEGGNSHAGLDAWLRERDPKLDRRIREVLEQVRVQIEDLHRPFDRMLAFPADHPARRQAENLVESLGRLGDLVELARGLAVEDGKRAAH